MRDGSAPVLVREGFSWGALIFGPIWLAVHNAWVPAALVLAASILIGALTSGPTQSALLLALVLWLGFTGNDLRRWSLRLRGFVLQEVVSARNATEALGVMLERRPDLTSRFLPPGVLR
ncbi:MAG TPA: DUF2628 domain-containing protein [Acetobacteraceae bacterium]|nr:DUF2628 domain-containing protein [Acetobacteraceae bacterium]